jgi:two-component sensor histidine kinase
LGLIAHELATNALKHGALSTPEGRVAVSWSWELHDDRRVLAVRWREVGGPPVRPLAAKGFGSTLIEREVRHDLSGSLKTEFLPDGIRVAFTIPAASTLVAEPAQREESPHAVRAGAAPG